MRDDEIKEIKLAREHLESVIFSSAGAVSKIDVLPLHKATKAQAFGKLFSFSEQECKQLETFRDLITQYIEQRSSSRPLCLSLFGPPGSGKSFVVKQLMTEVEANLRRNISDSSEFKLKLPITTLNLTQVSASNDLARALARIAGEQDDDTVPIVFFDEFDASRGSAVYGWLAWFLAPMNDGEILIEGALVRLKRAIYVFAGGTAATMDEFLSHSSEELFRSAKGPDFASRLHGFANVEGPNVGPNMPLRRALIFRVRSKNGPEP